MLSAGDANETMGGAILPSWLCFPGSSFTCGQSTGKGEGGLQTAVMPSVDAAAKGFRSFLILLFEPHEHLAADISQREKPHKTISTNMVFQAAFFHGECQRSNSLKELLTIT